MFLNILGVNYPVAPWLRPVPDNANSHDQSKHEFHKISRMSVHNFRHYSSFSLHPAFIVNKNLPGTAFLLVTKSKSDVEDCLIVFSNVSKFNGFNSFSPKL